VPVPDLAALLEQIAPLRRENAALQAANAALRAENVALQERIRDLEARLGQHSANSSRPPSSDPPQAPAKRRAPASGRKRGGQVGPGAFRGPLPVEQVDELVVVVPQRCRHGEQPFAETTGRSRGLAWRHQVVSRAMASVRLRADGTRRRRRIQ